MPAVDVAFTGMRFRRATPGPSSGGGHARRHVCDGPHPDLARIAPEVIVTARRWAGGWELWHGGEVWTQVARLGGAETQVRDYVDSVEPGADHRGWVVTVIPEIVEPMDGS